MCNFFLFLSQNIKITSARLDIGVYVLKIKISKL